MKLYAIIKHTGGEYREREELFLVLTVHQGQHQKKQEPHCFCGHGVDLVPLVWRPQCREGPDEQIS